MEDMNEMEEKEDIYYVEIKNDKRFKGVYVNKKVILENEIGDDDDDVVDDEDGIGDEISFIRSELNNIMNEILKLNIDNDFKKYLFRRELEIFKLKRKLKKIDPIKLILLEIEIEQLKSDLLGTEDDNINENIDEDLFD